MRVDKQTISYWSMNEKEHALVIDALQHIGVASVDKLQQLIGENRRTAVKYRQEVRDLLAQVGEPVTEEILPEEDEIVTPLSEEEVAEINAQAADYGPFKKSNR